MALKTISAAELQAKLADHASHPDKPLDLSGYNLRNADFSGHNLDNVNFDGSDLRGTVWEGATVGAGTSFKKATVDPHDMINAPVDLSDVQEENMPASLALIDKRAEQIKNTADAQKATIETDLKAAQTNSGQQENTQETNEQAQSALAAATRATEEAQRAKAQADQAKADADTQNQAAQTAYSNIDSHATNDERNQKRIAADAARVKAQQAASAALTAQQTLDGAARKELAAKAVYNLLPQVRTAQADATAAGKAYDKAHQAFVDDANAKTPTGKTASGQIGLHTYTPPEQYDVYPGNFGPLLVGVDGKGGTVTTKATLEYQALEGLPQTGTLDAATRKRMISNQQQALIDLGDLPDPTGNAADGVAGPGYTAALKKFQKRKDMKPTGIPDNNTLDALRIDHDNWLNQDANQNTKDELETARKNRVAHATGGLQHPADLLNVAQYDATRTGVQAGTGLHFTAKPGDEAHAYLTAQQRQHFKEFAADPANADIMQAMFDGHAQIKGSDLVIDTNGMTQEQLQAFYANRVVLQRILAGDANGAKKAYDLQNGAQKMTPYEAATVLHSDAAAAKDKPASSLLAQARAAVAGSPILAANQAGSVHLQSDLPRVATVARPDQTHIG